MKNELNKTEIIPVTELIRQYLQERDKNKELIESFAQRHKFSKEEYDIEINNKIYTIERKDNKENKRKERIIQTKLFLIDIAKKLNKSLIWVYQELVLNGYGEDIDPNSEIYQVALLANEDVSIIKDKYNKKELIWYENLCILNGHLYEEMLCVKRVTKKLKKN